MSRRTRILAFAAVAALGLTWWLSVRDQVNLPLPDLSSVEPEVRDHLERVRADALAHPNFESLMQLGRSYQAQGIIEETLAVYRLAEACGDDPFEPLYLRAVIQQTRDLEDARVSLETALAARPASIHALVRMGETLVQLERPLEAEQYYRRALAIDPEDAGAWLGIGRVEMARKNSLEARRALQKSLEVNPKDGTAWSLLATLLQREGRRDEARKAGDRGRGLRGNRAKLDPYTDAVHAANPSSSGLRWRANVAASRGQLEEASRLMVETLKRRPNDASAWVEFGLIQLQQRRFEDARRSARKARELEPDSAGACELEATAFGLEGRVPEAITTLRKGLEAQPESISLMASLAAAIYPTEPDEALKLTEIVLDKDPINGDASYVRAMILARDPNTRDLAMIQVEDLLAVEPQRVPALELSVHLLVANGERSRAIESLQTILKIDPTNARARRMLATLNR